MVNNNSKKDKECIRSCLIELISHSKMNKELKSFLVSINGQAMKKSPIENKMFF